MIIRYNDIHKTYRLVDDNTNLERFSRGVTVDKEIGFFQTPYEFKIIIGKSVVAKDPCLNIQIYPP